VGRVEEVVWTLRNSVERYVVDKDFKLLMWRVDWALLELRKISSEFLVVGLKTVARFAMECCELFGYVC